MPYAHPRGFPPRSLGRADDGEGQVFPPPTVIETRGLSYGGASRPGGLSYQKSRHGGSTYAKKRFAIPTILWYTPFLHVRKRAPADKFSIRALAAFLVLVTLMHPKVFWKLLNEFDNSDNF